MGQVIQLAFRPNLSSARPPNYTPCYKAAGSWLELVGGEVLVGKMMGFCTQLRPASGPVARRSQQVLPEILPPGFYQLFDLSFSDFWVDVS